MISEESGHSVKITGEVVNKLIDIIQEEVSKGEASSCGGCLKWGLEWGCTGA
jgi:hypothetical protein